MDKLKHVYIHIPITNSNCNICDVNKIKNFSINDIINEINNKKINSTLETLYIGGNNPGELNLSQMMILFSKIRKHFKEIKEFSFETHPHSLTNEKIEILKKFNINRIVLKTKTFDQKTLEKWNMKNRTKSVFYLLRDNGFQNISLDMNFGFSKQVLLEDVKNALDLKPESIHWYSHKLEAEICDLKIIEKQMNFNLYNRYEFSGFAQKGFESKHSIAYWNSKKWIGIGKGSYSFIIDDACIENLSNNKNIAQDVIIRALQYEKGLNLSNKLHNNCYKIFENKLTFFINKKYLIKKNNYIFINKNSWEKIDEIIKVIL